VDVGRDTLAWAAVVHAEGPEAPAAIRRIADTTGWRIFVPRRGSFLQPHELQQP
jgi:hypothetical protein